jgi:hypothetical protein
VIEPVNLSENLTYDPAVDFAGVMPPFRAGRIGVGMVVSPWYGSKCGLLERTGKHGPNILDYKIKNNLVDNGHFLVYARLTHY